MNRRADLSRVATWTTGALADYPSLPYPGSRLSGSWRLTAAGLLHELKPLDGESLRDLATGEMASLGGRILVLAYGSNANPQKLRARFAGTEVLALPAEVDGWAAVWCSARRASGDVVCTLAPVAGARERHVVLAVTPVQLQEMDRWEGHPRYYRRAPFTGRITLGNGSRPAVEVYLGTSDRRPALLIDGCPLRCSEVSYDEVDRLVGKQP